LIAISAAYYLSIPYQIDKPKLLFGRTVIDMGPTLFPQIAAYGLFLSSVVYLLQSLITPEHNPFRDIIPRARRDIAVMLVALFCFATAFEPLGFIIASFGLTAGISIYLGNRNPLTIAALSVGVTSSVYWVFTNLLQIALPEGLLS
jgi:putative tricarboxylic transport membrane protein